jgi:hypothetical protein
VVATGAIFVALFASANLIVARAFSATRWPSIGEVAFWLAMPALTWPALRPSRWRHASSSQVTLPGALMPSVCRVIPGACAIRASSRPSIVRPSAEIPHHETGVCHLIR